MARRKGRVRPSLQRPKPQQSVQAARLSSSPHFPLARNPSNLTPPATSSSTDRPAHPLLGRSSEITHDKQEEAAERRPTVRIFFPDNLKEILVDDWEKVTKNMQLVVLPSKTPVTYILDQFFAEEIVKRREGSAEADVLEEVRQGIVDYFNRSLGKILLYRFEREQLREMYERINSGTDDLAGKTLADVYGAEHLCRLLGMQLSCFAMIPVLVRRLTSSSTVSFPELISQTNMDAPSVERLKRELSILITWLNKNIPTYLSTEYVSASQEYIDQFTS
ncbi:MAG: hypothetical protein Q9157_000030 [Trypethelium eluteriae]